jgi:hypothetical protein
VKSERRTAKDLSQAMQEGLAARTTDLTSMSRPRSLPRAWAGPWSAKGLLVRLTIVAAFFSVPALLVWHATATRRTVRSLAPADRRAKYDAALRDFEELCAHPEEAFRDHCGAQAELLLAFPECDDACRIAARSYLGVRPLPPR